MATTRCRTSGGVFTSLVIFKPFCSSPLRRVIRHAAYAGCSVQENLRQISSRCPAGRCSGVSPGIGSRHQAHLVIPPRLERGSAAYKAAALHLSYGIESKSTEQRHGVGRLRRALIPSVMWAHQASAPNASLASPQGRGLSPTSAKGSRSGQRQQNSYR